MADGAGGDQLTLQIGLHCGGGIALYADDDLYAAIARKLPSLKDDAAKTDIISWFGSRHAASQAGTVIAAIASPDPELALAAIRAAGRIGGQEALDGRCGETDCSAPDGWMLDPDSIFERIARQVDRMLPLPEGKR